jgi:hypothetical protein
MKLVGHFLFFSETQNWNSPHMCWFNTFIKLSWAVLDVTYAHENWYVTFFTWTHELIYVRWMFLLISMVWSSHTNIHPVFMWYKRRVVSWAIRNGYRIFGEAISWRLVTSSVDVVVTLVLLKQVWTYTNSGLNRLMIVTNDGSFRLA